MGVLTIFDQSTFKLYCLWRNFIFFRIIRTPMNFFSGVKLECPVFGIGRIGGNLHKFLQVLRQFSEFAEFTESAVYKMIYINLTLLNLKIVKLNTLNIK